MIKYVLIPLFCACFILLGCVTTSSAKDFQLFNTDWRLDTLASKHILSLSKVRMHFAKGSVAGSTGCNQFNASYEEIGTRIKFSKATSTKMWCALPEGVMQQESFFLKLLQESKSYAIEAGVLTFIGEDGTKLLVFSKQ